MRVGVRESWCWKGVKKVLYGKISSQEKVFWWFSIFFEWERGISVLYLIFPQFVWRRENQRKFGFRYEKKRSKSRGDEIGSVIRNLPKSETKIISRRKTHAVNLSHRQPRHPSHQPNCLWFSISLCHLIFFCSFSYIKHFSLELKILLN